MAKNILHMIESGMSGFSKGQKRIAGYILENYDKAAFMTASKLGKLVGVSESTVVRFASELGYDGYPSMQRALQEMIRSRLTSTPRIQAAGELFDRIVDKNLLVRRLSISANRLICEADAPKEPAAEQLDLFTDYAAQEERRKKEDAALVRERKVQEAMLGIKKKFGKNAILKGMNLEEGATARERNKTIGGHHE